KLGVVDAQGRDRATLDGAGFRADYGDLVLLGNLDQGGDTGDHHVVGGNVDGIHITECVHGLLDLIDGGHGLGLDVDAEGACGLLHGVHLDLGVDLTGGIDDADAVHIRDELTEELELILDRGRVGGAGDVATRCVVGVHELGGLRIGDSGEQNRDVGDVLGGGLGGRGGYSQDQVQVVGGELLGDGQRGALFTVGVLLLEG